MKNGGRWVTIRGNRVLIKNKMSQKRGQLKSGYTLGNKVLIVFMATWLILGGVYTASALDVTYTHDFERFDYELPTIEDIKQACSSDAVECSWEAKLAPKQPTVEVKLPETSYTSTEAEIRKIAYIQCTKRGFGDYCVDDLVAMAWVESRHKCNAVGDGGKSHGCFQIHLGYHKHVTVEQARDISFSLSWTLNRLVSKGYPKYRSNSLRSHNGSITNPRTYTYLQSINKYLGIN